MHKPIRCCNLDWLEVHALEPQQVPHDADFFRKLSLDVIERDYGTRVYKEMFTVCDANGKPFVEVRRNPFSQGFQGIHAAEECHLRLVNAACYYDNAALLLRQFMDLYDYQFQRIVRVDVCMDFERFDHGDKPADFVRRYFKHKYAKINQGKITAHGADRWDGQTWNSLSWGAPTSDIGTKLYDKTMELYDPKTQSYGKPHVRYAWLKAGLIDDFSHTTKMGADGKPYTPQIWRVEFSIRSSVKKWFAIELNGKRKAYQSIRNTLDMYDSRDKLVTMFASLANHYFHFKHSIVLYDFYKSGSTEGKAVRKDRCPDKVLFDFSNQQITYKVGRDTDANKFLADSRRAIKPLDSLIRKIREYQSTHFATDVHEACQVLIRTMEGEKIRADMEHPWSTAELQQLQLLLAQKTKGNDNSLTVIMNEIKELLKINDNTAIF